MGKAVKGMLKLPFLVLLIGVLLGINAHEDPRFPGHTHDHVLPKQHQHHLQPPQPSPEEGRCTSLVRRTTVGQQLVTYPCFKPIPGVVPQVAHPSPMGLICQAYVRVPMPRYFRVVTCCPGWRKDQSGACVKPDRHLLVQPAFQQKRLEDLTLYPSSYEEDKRHELMSHLRRRPLARYGNTMSQWAPRAMIMRQMQMLMEQLQMIARLKREMLMRRQYSPLTPINHLTPTTPPGFKLLQVIRRLRPQLQRRANNFGRNRMNIMGERPFPIIPKPQSIHERAQEENMFQGPIFIRRLLPNIHNEQRLPDLSTNDLRPNPNLEAAKAFPHLPKFPVEQPPIRIQPGPNNPLRRHINCLFSKKKSPVMGFIRMMSSNGVPPTPPCFAGYVQVVKKCLQNANVELPPEQNLLPGQSAYDQKGVCEKRQVIVQCIMSNIRPCDTFGEELLVRRTLSDTMEEINKDCQIHELESIETRLTVDPAPDSVETKLEPVKQKTITTETETNPIPEQVQVVDLTDPKLLDQKEVPLKVEQKEKEPVQATPETKTETKQTDEPKTKVHHDGMSDHHHHHSHPHPQKVQVEEANDGYYLPLLIGTAIGVAAILILLSALLCICCKKRIKRRLSMEKEPEKPKLFDGIYTIGLPPPIYEVNGIPPISYEEAKGQKITGSPSSLRRHNMENEAVEQNDSIKSNGVISDI